MSRGEPGPTETVAPVFFPLVDKLAQFGFNSQILNPWNADRRGHRPGGVSAWPMESRSPCLRAIIPLGGSRRARLPRLSGTAMSLSSGRYLQMILLAMWRCQHLSFLLRSVSSRGLGSLPSPLEGGRVCPMCGRLFGPRLSSGPPYKGAGW